MATTVSRIIKSILDRWVAAILLTVLSPVMAVIAIVVYLKIGRPILFHQLRPGKNGKIFTFYKFRTMSNKRDAQGRFLSDEQRLSPFGQLLRQTSLDELPQLWNVLKGDMSIVGPRPLLVEYLERYTPEQAQRHDVKPGITGWAQVNGRNSISWEEKFEHDTWYVRNWSLWCDLQILGLTLLKVLRRDGISRPGHATMPEFHR